MSETLTPEKEKLLAKLLGDHGATGKWHRIVRGTDGPEHPQSFAQRMLWFQYLLRPYSSAYNIHSATRLRGPLQVQALNLAVNAVVARHEPLRTLFDEDNGLPIQRVSASLELTVPTIDLTHFDEERKMAEAMRLIHGEAVRPFDLRRGPLLRLHLIKLSTQEHILLFNVHHIVADGWSLGVLAGEVSEIYRAKIEGQEAKLAGLPIRYADYARWQHKTLKGQTLESLLSFWKSSLQDAPPILQLPYKRSNGTTSADHGSGMSFRVEYRTTELLRKAAGRSGASLFMILFATYAVLLRRYSGQDDIVIGTPIAGRHSEEMEPLIGHFVNMLAIRVRLTGALAFADLLLDARAACLAAFEHQALPFDRLVEELAPDRNVLFPPIFQAVFSLQNAPGEPLSLADLSATRVEYELKLAKFPIALDLEESNGGLDGVFQFSTAHLDESVVRAMMSDYQRMLETIAVQVNVDVRSLSAPDRATYRRVVDEFNRTELAITYPGGLHVLFERQAELTPNSVAVEAGANKRTYADVNSGADRFAHALVGRRVNRGDVVGVLLPRSPVLIEALLGILKSGATYLPMDPAYPDERLRLLLADSGAVGVVTNAELGARLPHRDSFWKLSSEMLEEPPGPVESTRVDPEQAAYLIYTSGSTGQPKGVIIEHQNAVALLNWAWTAYGRDELSRVLASTSICFDLSVFEIFVPLSVGGCVVVVDSALDLAESHRVTLLNTVPSIMTELIRFDRLPSSVRTVNLAGEALPLSLVKDIERISPHVRLLNLYGPSEDTTYSTWHEVDPSEDVAPPIGRPIANTQAYVLDADMNPVPLGVTGEIYLGGAGVARGYLGRPELTKERFVNDPFSGQPKARLYKTGDRGRQRSDGTLEYLGRGDGQVKIRGCRIELAEVEVVAEACAPGFRVVVDFSDADSSNGRRLIGFLECGIDAAPAERDLISKLRSRLPEVMVPTEWSFVETFPRNSNGKIDRAKLRLSLPLGSIERDESEYRPPVTELQKQMVEIWERVLDRDRIGIGDNFFDLGGHSLLATQVVSRLRKTTAVELPLQTIFEFPTIETLCLNIEGNSWASTVPPPPLLPLAMDESQPKTVVQSFAQQRLWFLDQLEPGSTAYLVGIAMKMTGFLDLRVLQSCFDALVERHEALRTVFDVQNDQMVQIVLPPTSPLISIANLDALPESERDDRARQLMKEEVERPMNLQTGPLLRVNLIRLSAEHHLLQITTHHIVNDAWSIGVLVDELSVRYRAGIEGNPASLQPLAIQYTDFAAWQKEWIQFGVLEALLHYWRQRLEGAPDTVALPFDRPRHVSRGFRGARVGFAFDSATTSSLQALAKANNATLFIVLLAAFKALLFRYTGQDDMVVGSPIANRNRDELEPLIGFFVNTLVLRTDLSGDPDFRKTISRVRDVALGAYAHQDLPFEKLVEQLGPERRWGRSPLFQVMFVLQNAPAGELSLPGLKLSPVRLENTTAKFDLSLHIQQVGDRIEGECEFSSDLFETSTITRMMSHYQGLVAAVLEDPSRRLSQLKLLSSSEHDNLRQWGEGRKGEVVGTVLSWFDALVLSDAGSPALVEDGETVSYGSLHTRSLHLAQTLAARGVGDSGIVGLALSGLVDRVTAMLASWRLGAAFLPLDLSHPQARLHWMLEDAGAVMVLARGDIGWDKSRTLDLYGIQWPEGAMAVVPAVDLPAGLLAYVIYTSGSSGRPKCVEIDHSGLANLVVWHNRTFAVDKTSMASQLAGPAFDASLWEIWPYLSAGGTVSAVPAEIRVNPEALILWLSAHGMTHAFMPTPLGEACLDEPWPESTRLKTLLVGGDVLHRRPRSGLPFRLYNAYGPTEGTVVSTCDEVLSDEIGLPPIGRPIDNVRVYVLDAHGEPVPIGVAGELCIAGRGLARGYRGDEQRTAEQFVEHGEFAGGRVYRSGDRARFRADGRLEFLGRLDAQIKLRGMRIEPGEIEAELLAIEGVSEALVVADDIFTNTKRLVAYVVPAAHANPDVDNLLESLRLKLPEHMVPTSVVFLDRIPVTANGKLDRTALPSPSLRHADFIDTVLPPRDAIERALVEIWEELLGVSPIGISQNFFALGGHSLLAARLQGALRERFGLTVPFHALFQNATISNLSEFIRAHHDGETRPSNAVRPTEPVKDGQQAGFWSRLKQVFRSSRRPPKSSDPARTLSAEEVKRVLVSLQEGDPGAATLVLIHPVAGRVFCYGELVAALGKQCRIFGLESTHLPKEERSIETLADYYATVIGSLAEMQREYHILGWSLGGLVAFDAARLLYKRGNPPKNVVLIDSFPTELNRADDSSEESLLAQYAADLAAQYGQVTIELPSPPSATSEGFDVLWQTLIAAGIDIDRQILESSWQEYRINRKAWARFKPENYAGRVHLITATETLETQKRTPLKIWGSLANGGFGIDVLPGNHYTLLKSPLVHVVANRLDQIIRTSPP